MPLIRILEGAGSGKTFELIGKVMTLGRESANHIQIADVKASRVHAELRCDGGRWSLKDLESSNGTWGEGGRISSLPLVDGVRFRIGKTWMRYESGKQEATQLDETESEGVEGLDPSRSALLDPVRGPEALARISAYLSLLHRIVLKSHAAKTRDALFELLDDAAAEALEGDRCAVFLPAPQGWTLWPAHEKRLRARYGAVPFAQTLLAAVRTRREPLLCTLKGDLDPSQSMVQAGVRSAMAAPLRIGDESHGLLYVDRIEGDKPFARADLEFLAAVANQLAVQIHNRDQVAELTAEVGRLAAAPRKVEVQLIGSDPQMKALDDFVSRAGPADAPVLITGESGTGKEVVARLVHARSKRADRPLQVVNCAALAESIVESTLFGHVKGAFTGADETRPGVFELADRATLFLDELGELPLAVQAKLLRALEQGEVQRVGDGALRKVDVRVIAATNRDLKEEVQKGRFREDLFHRLDVLAIALPPLRHRPGDVEALIDHFMAEHARRLGQEPRHLAPEARTILLRYPWPGNVRQLRNVLERACIMAAGKLIRVEDLPQELRDAEPVVGYTSPLASMAEVERMHILRVLEHCGGNKKAAAEVLGIDRSTLYAKLRQYGQI